MADTFESEFNESDMSNQFPEPDGIPIPNDLHELRYIPQLIDKVPLYISKMKELKEKIEEFSKIAVAGNPIRRADDIENLIYRAFFIELENRNYSIKRIGAERGETEGIRFELRRVRWRQVISNRNAACEICGENRTIDKCHIIPNKFGGTRNSDNILILCPTHHRLFDRFMLSRQEYASINWSTKSKASQYYADTTLIKNHKKFWSRIESGNNSPILSYENEEWNIYRYVINEVISMFTYNSTINKQSIFKIVDENIKDMAKGVVKILLKNKILIEDSNKKFLTLAQPDFQDDVYLAKECWQELN